MSKLAIEAVGLFKTYYSEKNEVLALNNVKVKMEQGDFVVIMGSSGSGKSTLLHTLSGLDSIDEGTIKLDEYDISNFSEKEMAFFRREKFGFIFQDFNLVNSLSLLENLLIAGFLLPGNKKETISRSMNLLDKVGLKGLEDRFPTQVSGGQQQRAAIARALINNPSILFADEPTGNLNSKSSNQILDLLNKLNEQGQTIVMVTHDLKAACRGNKIFFLRDGKIDGELSRSVVRSEFDETELYNWLIKKGW